MTSCKLRIAGAVIQIQCEFSVQISANYPPFLAAETAPADHTITVRTVDALPPVMNLGQPHLGQAEGLCGGVPCVVHGCLAGTPSMVELHPAPGQTVCLYRADRKPLRLENLFNDLGLETVLWHFDTMILHSSFIRWKGRGILFSAPCGTGKSTQADLWQKYMGADILNGDRSGLRKIDGLWVAHGLPYAGTSGIYRQEKAPVAAVVMLEQAPENTIVPMNPAQALRKIWPEVSLHRWDRAFTEKGLNLLTDFVTAVPFYKLSCRPDEGAVRLLHDTITHEV